MACSTINLENSVFKSEMCYVYKMWIPVIIDGCVAICRKEKFGR